MEDAEKMAKEALSAYLASVIERNIPFSLPFNLPGAILIEPEPSVVFAWWLRQNRKETPQRHKP